MLEADDEIMIFDEFSSDAATAVPHSPGVFSCGLHRCIIMHFLIFDMYKYCMSIPVCVSYSNFQDRLAECSRKIKSRRKWEGITKPQFYWIPLFHWQHVSLVTGSPKKGKKKEKRWAFDVVFLFFQQACCFCRCVQESLV